MKNNSLKRIAKALYFRPNTVHRIRFGPLRGMIYKVDETTGLSAWYSGGERDHQNFCKKLVRDGDVVIDVGANWGVHSLYLSRLVGPSGMVIAFEALPEDMCNLQWHVNANHCSNVKIVRKAASERD